MVESYTAALKGVISSLQGACRSEDPKKIQKCKRVIEEKMITNEIGLAFDEPTTQWRNSELKKVKDCYDKCHVVGRYKIRECNTVCLNSMIQSIWSRVNVIEFEEIAIKYT